jgi:RHS repeat-associated protein
VIGTSSHLPFGEDAGSTGLTDKHKFTTYERDGETGTDYAVNRQHEPTTARFSRPDPVPGGILSPQTLNRFASVIGDPVNLTDPLGLCTISVAFDRGELGDNEVDAAQREIRAIFTGVAINFVAAGTPHVDYSLSVVSGPGSVGLTGSSGHALGTTVNGPHPYGYVYSARVINEVRRSGMQRRFREIPYGRGVVLGRAGAHELGHGLFGARHMPSGLMRASPPFNEFFTDKGRSAFSLGLRGVLALMRLCNSRAPINATPTALPTTIGNPFIAPGGSSAVDAAFAALAALDQNMGWSTSSSDFVPTVIDPKEVE